MKIFLLLFLFFPNLFHAQMPGMDMTKPASHKNKQPFEITARKSKSLSEEEVSALQAKQNKNKIIDSHLIIIDQNDAQIVITTGPAEDMFSYRIQGTRNPILAI